MRSLVWATAVAGLLVAASTGWAQQPAAISVGTVAAALRPVNQATEFVGRVEAINRVEVRARITGYLEDVLFKDGAHVKEGDVLYHIESDTFQAAVQQAQGDLLKAAGHSGECDRATRPHTGIGKDRRRIAGAARRADGGAEVGAGRRHRRRCQP